MEHREFRIGDLFEVKKGKRLTQADMLPGKIKFVGATSENNGETARIGNTEHIHAANTITVTYNGSVGEVFYQDEPFWASDDVNVLYPKFDMSVLCALYIMTVIRRLKGKYSYTHKWVKEFLENDMILLPITPDGSPNYMYMEQYISELERERISELERYLKVTGLEDFELTEEDKSILKRKVTYKKFAVVEIFNVRNTHSILKSMITTKGKVPYVTAGVGNNAVQEYVEADESITDQGNCIVIGGKTMVITYQANAFVSNDSHNLALYLWDKSVATEKTQLYLVGALSKALQHKYHWGDSISYKKIQNDIVFLPITSEGFPDYNYMEKYIRAQEKLAIRDAVALKDQIIQETRQVVGQGKE